MKKTYQTAQTGIMTISPYTWMIPSVSSALDPAPARHWVPGPGASYNPPANVV